ncbi:hypothetical protein TNIN_297871 [Trichonephila inaurata madagascariensis]|uniref:Uncharacterized protein n=1 Tax=Trichonephila inaurata madagascariensis TaxID=2747483 RepID=A0A8X6Y4P0_9ARAC|nr:hypothetical protein TNIN_297871 [Trichonephila inaurata madagascariensis]
MGQNPKATPPFHPLRRKEPSIAELLPNFSSRFQVGASLINLHSFLSLQRAEGQADIAQRSGTTSSMLSRTAEYEGRRKRPRNLHIASTIPPPTSSASLMRTAAP